MGSGGDVHQRHPPPGRTVTLVLIDAGGAVLGALPPLALTAPYWQESADVVAGARHRYGIDVQVLRLLHADRPHPPGGHLTLLARTAVRPDRALAEVPTPPPEHPRRAPWAVPGGPDASLRWAVETLAAAGVPGAVAVQQRTWNLSAIWRLDAAGTAVAWLKQVPPFLRHEAAVLRLLADAAPRLAPTLLATGAHGRQLLGHVPGEDRYGADADLRTAVVADWHPVQAGFVGRVDQLLAAGVPDRRTTLDWCAPTVVAYRTAVPGLAALLAGLPARLAAVAVCGLPDTLVHGDLHPGNVRADGNARVIVDWGDAVVANPAYDILRLTEGLSPDAAATVVAHWARRWRAAVPGSDPERAVALLRPVTELRAAATYAGFLAAIEPAEHPYHAVDVPDRLAAAVTLEQADRDGHTVAG